MAEAAPQTFLFADLAGFTALTEIHGDEQAADLVDDFARQARALLPTYGATEVKMIGDALMLRAAEAAQGVRLACRLATEIGGQHGFPGIRVGIHTGPAVERDADWYGAAVNLASRVSGAASAGEVLVTEATKVAAESSLSDCNFRASGVKRFKNVREPVAVFAALGAGSPDARASRFVVDPVCRMSVDPGRAVGRRQHRGMEYRFCSEACAKAFDADPEHYHGQRSSRVSEEARERAASFLRWSYRRRRIDLEELDERLAQVFVAKTRGELTAVVTDLPGHRRLRRVGRRWWLPGPRWLRRRRG